MKGIYVTRMRARSKGKRDVFAGLFETIREVGPDDDIVSLVYMDPPDLILIDYGILAEKGSRILGEFRSTSIIGHIPIVAVVAGNVSDLTALLDHPVDDYVFANDRNAGLRLSFVANRAARETDMNPLTRLPGNETIIRTIQRALDEKKDLAVAWVDLDNFKPFNDRYGFSRGDEVITATARIIKNALAELDDPDGFIGHIGGDDFVFACAPENARRICEAVVERFDMVIKNFYNDEDLEAGGITSPGRDGVERTYPVMSVTIAVVLNANGRYSHYGQVSQDATEIKKYLKGLAGSNYMIDRRVKSR